MAAKADSVQELTDQLSQLNPSDVDAEGVEAVGDLVDGVATPEPTGEQMATLLTLLPPEYILEIGRRQEDDAENMGLCVALLAYQVASGSPTFGLQDVIKADPV